MIRFARFITESIHDHFRVSSHSEDWVSMLKDKAEERSTAYNKGFTGSITAETRKPLRLPVSAIAHLPGRNGEKPAPGQYKYDRLAASIKEQGGLHTKDNPISININHRGEGYLSEGNNRLAHAKARGDSHIYADVSYYNGAEKLTHGDLPAHKAIELHTPEK